MPLKTDPIDVFVGPRSEGSPVCARVLGSRSVRVGRIHKMTSPADALVFDPDEASPWPIPVMSNFANANDLAWAVRTYLRGLTLIGNEFR